ncbi:MAG: hypothetical protein HY235_18055 [Acidobacteria bacterium]|nr:hypothetical protein [Acidobacteriota bacterium]
MIPAESRIDAGIWSVPGRATVIEYSRPVLQGILNHVWEAFDAYLDGGYEVGGVLFGRHEGSMVRILAFRPLPMDPPPPSFVLSQADEKTLAALIRDARTDPELAGMEPAGWYHSKNRSEIFLSEADVDLYDRFFPEPWQVALVLRPSYGEPVRAGFFFREPDGFLRTDRSYLEFALDAPLSRRVLRKTPPWQFKQTEPVVASLPTLERYGLPPGPERPERTWRARNWIVLPAALALVVAGILSVLWLRQAPPLLGLQVFQKDGDLLIYWDAQSPAVQEATEGVLFIVDGGKRTDRPLSRSQLRQSPLVWRPQSGRIDVRLRIQLPYRRTAQETSTFLAHPDQSRPSPELIRARIEKLEAEQQTIDLGLKFIEKQRRREQIEARIGQLTQARETLSAIRKQKPAPKRLLLPSPKPALPGDLPAAPEIALTTSAQAPLIAIPQPEVRVRPPTETPQPAPPFVPSAAPAKPVLPPPAPAAAAARPAPGGPLAGKIIWIGDLPRDAVLTIAGRKPSRGFVNSELPGVPVRVGAYAAEISDDGLRILTPNPKSAGQAKVEPPSAANGWTRTQYVYDARSARDVIVEQMPGPQDYRRVVLRAGPRKLSAIVIEWQVIQP